MIARFLWKHTLTTGFRRQYGHDTVGSVSRIYVSEELRGRFTESGCREGRRPNDPLEDAIMAYEIGNEA